MELENAAIAAGKFADQGFWASINWSNVGDLLTNGLVTAFDSFSRAVANGVKPIEAARDAFLQFAADFLLQIARMIQQQIALNIVKSIFGGTSIGAAIGVGSAHSGGRIGSVSAGSGGNLRRRIDPSVFSVAPRMHGGGIVGLRPGEVPIIAKQGEEMLTENDPRHFGNFGGTTPSQSRGMTVINAVDGSAAMEQALSQSAGQDVFINFMRSRKNEIVQVLGITR